MDRYGFTFLGTIFYIMYVAVLWRMRGGAFATLAGVDIGTGWTRAWCGLLMSVGWIPILGASAFFLEATIFIGLSITGWEEFEGMGTETGYLVSEKPGYWMRWLPIKLGLLPVTIPYDLLGMAQAGLVCMAPTALLAAWLSGWHVMPAIIMLLCGLGFGPAYLLARLPLPAIPNFAHGQSWGEVFTGALIGAALVLAFP